MYGWSTSPIPLLFIYTIPYHGRHLFPFTEPFLYVRIEPRFAAILDVSPYNNLTLLCTASVPSNVTGSKVFEWSRTVSGSSSSLTHNGNTTIINSFNLDSATSVSTLTVTMRTLGSISYTCTATILGEMTSETSTVLVKGNYMLLVSIHF